VKRSDRLANAALFALAVAAWLAVAYVVFNFDPRQDSTVLLAGALLLGSAAVLTLTPLLWIGSFLGARRIAFGGAWWGAIRRALLVGLVVAAFVVLRGQAALTPALGLFIVVMAVLVEATFSLRR
jgi:hypothetical protein